MQLFRPCATRNAWARTSSRVPAGSRSVALSAACVRAHVGDTERPSIGGGGMCVITPASSVRQRAPTGAVCALHLRPAESTTRDPSVSGRLDAGAAAPVPAIPYTRQQPRRGESHVCRPLRRRHREASLILAQAKGAPAPDHPGEVARGHYPSIHPESQQVVTPCPVEESSTIAR